MIQLVDFHQEVEDIRVLDRVKDRLLGEDQTLIIVLRVLRGADGDIHDEHFARTREKSPESPRRSCARPGPTSLSS